jgi:uncharacterized protein
MSEIRDTIHGFVYRSDQEESLINSKVFQRLRGIGQLALANLVYPGALHTRFDHSIGVMHIGGRMAYQLGLNEEERNIIRIACLLHDIGHGPFSHVSEELLEKLSPIKGDVEREEIHELITCNIIEKSKELNLLDQQRDKIIDLIKNYNQESIDKGIVTGPIDADKQDYLLRDSYYCGVKYGVFDLERLIESLIPIDKGIEKVIAVKESGKHAIEQYVISKYHMSTQVYKHKIRLVSDAMIVNGLDLGINEDGLQFLKDIYFYEENDRYVENYLQWDDSRIFNEILHHTEKGYCKEIFTRLKQRRLFKSIYHRNIKDFENPIHRDFLGKLNSHPQLKVDLQNIIAIYLTKKVKFEVLKQFILIVTFGVKSFRDEKSKDNIGEILIKFDDGRIEKFEEQSTLFQSISKQEREQFIEIFAPISWESDKKKKELRKIFNQEIHPLIIDCLKNYEVKNGLK